MDYTTLVEKRAFTALLLIAAAGANAQIWYGGDYEGGPALESGINTSIGDARVYDNYSEPLAGTTVDSVFGNFLVDGEIPNQIYYEFRENVSPGNGGQLLSFGTVDSTAAKTGRSGMQLAEWAFIAEIPRLQLEPGTYWMTIAPVGNGAGHYYLSTTSGFNGIGAPLGDGNSYYDSISLAASFDPTTVWLGAGIWDFSMGFSNHVIPEPTTSIGILTGISLLLVRRGAKRKLVRNRTRLGVE